MLRKWKKISSKLFSENPYWSYYIDEYEIDEHFKGEYHYVHTKGSTMIIPMLEDKFILVEQYRYLNQKTSIEFPCGSIEKHLDEISNAKKELEEETGFTTKNLVKIGFFSPYNGVADEYCSVFFTNQLEPCETKPDKTEGFNIYLLYEKEIDNLITENKIWDGMTIAAWTLFQKRRNNL